METEASTAVAAVAVSPPVNRTTLIVVGAVLVTGVATVAVVKWRKAKKAQQDAEAAE